MTTLRDYQQDALDAITDAFSAGMKRITVPMPCGTGKTVVAAHLIRSVGGRTIVFVPTVELLTQTVRVLSADNPDIPAVCVCSRTSVDDGATQVDVARQHSLDVTTDVDELAAALTSPALLVVSTYASAHTVAAATERAGITWDVLVCDEAHRTVGLANRHWSMPIHDEVIPARRRAFFTATTRTIEPPKDISDLPDPADAEVVSMDSLEEYGPHIPTLTLRDAIDRGVLTDYEVAIVAVSDRVVLNLIDETPSDQPMDAYAAATQLAVMRTQETHPELKSIMAFHNRIASSQQWVAQLEALAAVDNRSDSMVAYHVDATSEPRHRTKALHHLAQPGGKTVVVSNCRLFSEGIDVPALDGVLFAAPRSSAVDIVQIVGRALRPHPDRSDRKALVVLPVIFDSGDDNEAITAIARSSHLAAWQVLSAMGDVDATIQKSIARLQMDAIGEGEEQPPVASNGPVSVDTSMLAEGASLPFTLHTLSPLTAHHPQTVAYLRQFAAHTGSANPPSTRRWHNYPLGARVASARSQHAKGLLHKNIAAMYEDVPGFQWQPRGTARRGNDEWIDLFEKYVSATGIGTIAPYATTTDADSGAQIPIGRKLHDYRWASKLTPKQRARINRIGLEGLPSFYER